MTTSNDTLFYIHDPMCSWCWGFRPVWQQLEQQLSTTVNIVYIVGGLAPDSDQPMAMAMQQTLAATWQRIQQQIPGIEFNYDFWRHNSKTQPQLARGLSVQGFPSLVLIKEDRLHAIPLDYNNSHTMQQAIVDIIRPGSTER